MCVLASNRSEAYFDLVACLIAQGMKQMLVKAQVVSLDGIHTAGSSSSTLYYIEVCNRSDGIDGIAGNIYPCFALWCAKLLTAFAL